MNDIIEKPYEIYSLDMFSEDDEIEAYNRLCVIRSMAASESGASRPPNPEHVVH
jgi:hypothetical protein